MAKCNYRVDLNHWVDGSGVSHTETIDNITSTDNLVLPLEDIAEAYKDWCEPGDFVEVIDNRTERIVSSWQM